MSIGHIVITGASSGIGEGFARAFAREGRKLVLVARRADRLEALAAELRRGHGVEVRIEVVDFRDPAAVAALLPRLDAQGVVVEGLVNNAGLGSQASLARMEEAAIDAMLEVNVAALVRLTRRVLPGMLERGSGFVLNVASTAAFQPVPYFAVYAATKAFVVSFSEAVHEEVRGRGVLVTALCPGPTHTEFQQVAGMDPRFFARSQSVEEVVRAGLRLLRRRHGVGWTSATQWLVSFAIRFLPRRLVRWFAALLLRATGAA